MGRAKKALLVLAILLVLAVVVAAIVLYPYYKMPDVDQAALEAKLAEWRTVAAELENRPKNDREALVQLLDEYKEFLDLDFGYKQNECPPLDLQKVKNLRPPFYEEISALDQKLDPILAGGFNLQQDTSRTAEVLTFLPLRNLIKWQTAAALYDAEQGNWSKIYDRFSRSMTLAEGLANSPILIHSMMFNAMEIFTTGMILNLLPRLPEAEILRIQTRLRQRPDDLAFFTNALQIEAAGMSDLLTADNIAAVSKSPLKKLVKLAPWYIKRERLVYLDAAARFIAEYQAWLAAGAKGLPQEVVKPEDIKHNLTLSIAWPNWPELIKKKIEAATKHQALLQALEAELAHRKTGAAVPVEITLESVGPWYGKKKFKIVLNREYGCLVAEETAIAPRP